MKKLFFTYILTLSSIILQAQQPIQNLRGRVVDKNTQQPIPGVAVSIVENRKGTSTNENGLFNFNQLPVGRYSLIFSMLGYTPINLPLIDLGSGKETVLNIELVENPQFLNEVIVKAEYDKQKNINDLALVSGRQFTVEETNRYAGGYSDPARMAMSFAGVSSAGNDQNNEIIIRGNSPKGLLWRLEGIEIPNPNHFGNGQGSTGGIISMLNSTSLANSDFLTSAFPAEYGNASSGVFDLRFRRGNDQKHEFTAQLGIIGLDASAEGPIKKGGASYRINFRYSTLELLLKSGLLNIETGSFKPEYRDMNFTFNIPTKKAGTFNLFGLGGANDAGDENQTFKDTERGLMGISGLSHKISTGTKGYFYSVVAFSRESTYNFEQSLINNKEWVTAQENKYVYNTIRFSSLYNYKINPRLFLHTGVIISNLGFGLEDNRRDFVKNIMINLLNENNSTQFLQAYTQAKYNLNQKLSVTAGIHFNKFLLNNNQTTEPRLGLNYQLNENNTLSAGFGMHSRLEPISIYLIKRRKTGDTFVAPNQGLGLSRAKHFVIGYERRISQNTRLKLEAYYQKLYNVPVDTNQTSFFSMLNSTAGLTNTVLENTGSGKNYGLEMTIEKYFSKNYYFLITASAFDSKFKAKDNQWRNTIFNNTYVGNALFGKDFALGKNRIHWLKLNTRLTWRGGNRYVPINLSESRERNITVQDPANAFQPRYADYWRIDLGIAYKINKKSTTWTLSADLQNVTNRKNIMREKYDIPTKTIIYDYALPILPIINFKVDF